MRALLFLAAAVCLAAAGPPRIKIVDNLKGPLAFPPTGRAYRENPEAHRIWRSPALEAPDLVLIVGEDFGLADALSNNAVAGVGRIPARRIDKIPAKLP